MNNLFLTYELSLLLAHSGFNETCYALFSMNDQSFGIKQSGFKTSDSGLSIAAPTWDQAFKFLLDKANSYIDWQDSIELVMPKYQIVTEYFKDEFDRKEEVSGKEESLKWLIDYTKNIIKK